MRPAEDLELPELTWRAIAIGLALSVVMGAANVYLGLKLGLTVSASIPAAVLGSLLLRAFTGRGPQRSRRLEANQIQTAASAGESLAAGVIFTMPALLLIGYWTRFELWSTTLIALTGGLLGILFMVPMRRVFVQNSPELPYPEGVACAAVLESVTGSDSEAASGDTGARFIVQGGILGGAVKILSSGIGLIQGALETAWASGAGRIFFLGGELSPILVAVGFIVRLNVAFLVALGGAIGWLVCIPLLPEIRSLAAALPWIEAASGAGEALRTGLAANPIEGAYEIWSTEIRYIGVGAMAVGGAASLWKVRAGLVRAVAELRRSVDPTLVSSQERDLSSPVLIGLAGVATLGILTVYLHFTQSIPVTLLTTLLMAVLSFFFVAVASYIVGLVGNSNSPVSGMTITAVLITALLLFQFGYSGMQGMVATLGVAAIVCCAACTSGDVCNDLKTGQLVGASPRRQQIMQILGVCVASVVMAPVLQVLQDAYGIGSRELSAPQAGLFANLVQGFFGDASLPWDMVSFGVLLGVAALGIDTLLGRSGSSFRAHLMPIAVGIYLPFGLSLPLILGGLIAHAYARTPLSGSPSPLSRSPSPLGGSQDDAETVNSRLREEADRLRPGVLFSSGVIAGEALTGVAIAILVSSQIRTPSFEFAAKPLLSLAVAATALVLFGLGTRPQRSR